jgi:lipopolysaccharide export system permease protein
MRRWLVLKKLDLYIMRKFVSAYLLSITALSVLIVVFDLSERIDDFVEKKAPLDAIMFDYFGTMLPFFINNFSALFAFIAVIFFTSKLATHTEIVAMLSTGIGFNRILRPYFIVAAGITIASCCMSNFVIPQATATRYRFEERYIRNPYNNNSRHIHRQASAGVFVYIESFNVRDQIAYKFSIEHIENNMLRSKITSSYARWDTATGKWRMHNYVARDIGDSSEIITTGMHIDTALSITGKDFSVRTNRYIETMGFAELNEYIDALKLQGASIVNDALIEKHKRFAYPMANLILMVIGVTVSCRKTRGGMGINLGVGIGLSFTYILFQRFSEMFVQGSIMTPAAALWMPNILFGIVGAFMYYKTPK